MLIEEMAHFDRERIPERVVHAKGAGAFGYFEVRLCLIGQQDQVYLYKKWKIKQIGKSFISPIILINMLLLLFPKNYKIFPKVES